MAIDVTKEKLFTLHHTRHELLPAGHSGKPISAPTLWKWIAHGVRTASGEVVKLETAYVGGRPYVSKEAVERFIQATTAGMKAPRDADEAAGASAAAKPPKPSRSPSAAKQLATAASVL